MMVNDMYNDQGNVVHVKSHAIAYEVNYLHIIGEETLNYVIFQYTYKIVAVNGTKNGTI